MKLFSERLIAHTEALLKTLLEFKGSADKTVRGFFSTHPKLGQRERQYMTQAVFEVLRYKSELTYLTDNRREASVRQLALLGLMRTIGCAAVQAVVQAEEAAWLARAARMDPLHMPMRVRMNVPDWIAHALIERFGTEEGGRAAAALNAPAPLDLRVNPLKMSRSELLAHLAGRGIEGIATPLAPLGVRLINKTALHRVPVFGQGCFEIQDEGSQLIGHLLAPRRGETIVDFCAGAGGKTLALGALMRSTGRIYAFDVDGKRLEKLKPRLARSGLSNVIPMRIEHEQDKKLERLAGKIDRVLVDAPCSGLGTLRRNPDLKWRQLPESIDRLANRQISLLACAAPLVRPGGRLVYSTCSVLEAENEAVARSFMMQRPMFHLLCAAGILAKQKIHFDAGNCNYLSLWPHQHATDGFFAAVFERSM